MRSRSATLLFLALFFVSASLLAQTPTTISSGNGTVTTSATAPTGISATATSGYPDIKFQTGSSANSSAFRVFNSVSNELFRVQSDGNVGIGLSTLPATSRLTIWDGGNTDPGQRLALGLSTDYGYTIGRNHLSGFLELTGSDTGYGETYKAFAFNSKVGIGTQSSFDYTTLNALLQLNPTQLPTTAIASLGTFAGKGMLLQAPSDAIDNSQMGIMASFAAQNMGVGAGIIFARHAGDWGTRIQFHTHPPSTAQADMDKEPEVMRIDENGHVGIGTGNTAPTGTLHIGANYPVRFVDLMVAPQQGTSPRAGYLLDMPGAAQIQVTGLEIGSADQTTIPIIQASSGSLYLNKSKGADVVIGTSTSTGGLTVAGTNATSSFAGSVTVTKDVTVSGTLTGTRIYAVYQDVAEWVPASRTMEPGTVVVLNRERNNEVTFSEHAYDTAVAGVVSAEPGVVLGVPSASKAQIATTGRVKVHVDATRGAINVGDLLVTSDQAGTAMRSEPIDIGGVKIHRPGTVIGKALEPLHEGTGDILVLLSLQ